MEKVTDITVETSSNSKYIQLQKVKFNQNGLRRDWDMIKSHDSVSVLIHHIERHTFIFVKQFRPAVFVSQAACDGQDVLGKPIDTSVTAIAQGCTMELCAGLVDKSCSLDEIAKQEVLEECGYDVPVQSLQKITTTRGSVGTTGNQQTMFYAQVTEAMKKGPGGGNPEEGEYIELIEIPVKDSMQYVLSQNVTDNKSLGLVFAVMWHHQFKYGNK